RGLPTNPNRNTNPGRSAHHGKSNPRRSNQDYYNGGGTISNGLISEDSPLSKAAKRRQAKARKVEGPLQEQQNTPDVVIQPQQATTVAPGTTPALAPPIRTPNNPLVDRSRAVEPTTETTSTWTSLQPPNTSLSARIPRRARLNASQDIRPTLARSPRPTNTDSITRASAPPIPSRVNTPTHNPHDRAVSRAAEAVAATSSRPTASAWFRPPIPQPATSLTRVPPQEPSSQNFRPARTSQFISRTSGPTSTWSSFTSRPNILDPIYVDWVDSDSDD
ncbi:hypothetical protein FRC07_009740, partial [Ceratobasidium sp. 392]